MASGKGRNGVVNIQSAEETVAVEMESGDSEILVVVEHESEVGEIEEVTVAAV